MTSKAFISHSRCSKPLVTQCGTLYTKVIAEVYKRKGRPGALQQAIDDDEWRYITLPARLSSQGEKASLTKEELARLVRWKITHGINRPFLPAQIQKNDADTVNDHTRAAAKLLKNVKIDNKDFEEQIAKAVKEVTNLKGVGPATGSLVLSALSPDLIPFFEDELFWWLFPEHVKLKYDMKEYKALTRACQKLLQTHRVTALELEQTAYVLMHQEVLSDEEKQKLNNLAEAQTEVEADQTPIQGSSKDDVSQVSGDNVGDKSAAQAKPTAKNFKRGFSLQDDGTRVRRSKRQKK